MHIRQTEDFSASQLYKLRSLSQLERLSNTEEQVNAAIDNARLLN